LQTVIARPAVIGAVFWCIASLVALDASAASLERVEFGSTSQPLIPGDRIQGLLAKPDGAGPFPAVVGLHGCAGMQDTTKSKLADDLVASGYVTLLVDSFATRGIDHACTYNAAMAVASRRISDAYGALAFLAHQPFVDIRRVAAVGFSQGGWVTLSVAETRSFIVPRVAISGSGCILSSLQCGPVTPGDTDAHFGRGPRRLDAVRRLRSQGRQLGHRGTADRASRLSRHLPWFL
jgi:cephalosporin-C deacetylase-like acetyl esterase